MHVLVALVRTARPCLLRLTVLQHLEDLGLQKSKPEVVMCDDLVGGFSQVVWWIDETLLGNEPIIQGRWKFRRDDLISNPKGSSHLEHKVSAV